MLHSKTSNSNKLKESKLVIKGENNTEKHFCTNSKLRVPYLNALDQKFQMLKIFRFGIFA
jgi:hypothetical protein